MARHIVDLKQVGIKPAKVSSMKFELLTALLTSGGRWASSSQTICPNMRNDSRALKDAAVAGNENAYSSFLPRDTTLDELITSRSRFVRAVDLWALSLLTHHLVRKLELVDPRRYPGFDQAVHATVLILKSPQAQEAIDPLPRHLAEVGFAAHYFLKDSDLIPDKIPEVGLADDFAIFKQVFARNRLEIDDVIHQL
jgi:hypothetical protein